MKQTLGSTILPKYVVNLLVSLKTVYSHQQQRLCCEAVTAVRSPLIGMIFDFENAIHYVGDTSFHHLTNSL